MLANEFYISFPYSSVDLIFYHNFIFHPTYLLAYPEGKDHTVLHGNSVSSIVRRLILKNPKNLGIYERISRNFWVVGFSMVFTYRASTLREKNSRGVEHQNISYHSFVPIAIFDIVVHNDKEKSGKETDCCATLKCVHVDNFLFNRKIFHKQKKIHLSKNDLKI